MAVLVAVVAASPAAAAPRMTPSDRKAIGTLIDRFVKDAVLRENLAAAWNLAGPDLRGGTTRSAWIRGTGVTVQAYPARGNDFSNAWTGQMLGPGHAELSMIMHPKAGSHGYDEVGVSIDVRKIRGRWLVDLFYVSAVIRAGKGHQGSCPESSCAISGPEDYGPAGSAAGAAVRHGGAHWFLIGLAALGGLVVLTPLAIWARVKRRDRRAWAAYTSARR